MAREIMGRGYARFFWYTIIFCLVPVAMKNFEGEEKKIARYFHGRGYGLWFWDTSGAYIQTGFRVVRVEKCPGAPPFDPQSVKYYIGGTKFSGEIRLHTWFGVPYGKVVSNCQGEHRVDYFFLDEDEVLPG